MNGSSKAGRRETGGRGAVGTEGSVAIEPDGCATDKGRKVPQSMKKAISCCVI
jgi:hypothetical protein